MTPGTGLQEEIEALPKERRLEIVGRVHLWEDRLRECNAILHMALKANASRAANAERVAAGDLSVLDNSRPFPNDSELFNLGRRYLPMLATVIFCTILKSPGDPDPGKVAGNREDLLNRIREDLFARAFPRAEKRGAFDQLAKRLLEIRHEILAHVAGKAAGMELVGSDGLGSYNMMAGPTEAEFLRLHAFAGDLRNAIHGHPAYVTPG